LLEPLVELLAVPRMKLRSRDSFRRVLRMEIERQPRELGAELGA
jgi:hypothetical protein